MASREPSETTTTVAGTGISRSPQARRSVAQSRRRRSMTMRATAFIRALAELALTLTLLLAALVLGALWALAEAAGLLGVFLAIPLGAVTFVYPYSLLSAVAANREPPVATTAQLNPVDNADLLAHGIVLLGGLYALSLLTAIGPALYVLAGIAPASIAIMASTHRLRRALNPFAWLALVRATGVWYLAPIVVGAGMYGLAQSGPGDWPLIGRVLQLYLWLLYFATIGLMLHWSRANLDLPAASRRERRAADRRLEDQQRWDTLMSEVYVNLTRGDTERGYALLRGAIERDGESLALYAYVYETFATWRLPIEFAAYTRRYIERLIEGGDLQRALEITEAQLRHNPEFRPFAADVQRLTHYAQAVGHTATAGLLETRVIPSPSQ